MTDRDEAVQEVVAVNFPIAEWVESAKNDPVGYRNRQVTYILLSAIGLTPQLRDVMLLKGGALMMLGVGSPRGTQDVDFTITSEPEPFASELEARLNPALLRAAASLGYADLLCRVQRVKRRPRTETFESATGPALSITVAHARRGTGEEKRLIDGQSIAVIQVDLSFREPVFNIVEAQLQETSVTIRTYSLEEVIAEKFRALLQQPERNRTRRQDVFDLDWLSRMSGSFITDEVRIRIHSALKEKSAARGISPTMASMDNPEVARRAASDWNSLAAELKGELPPFDQAFANTRAFYLSLPWEAAGS